MLPAYSRLSSGYPSPHPSYAPPPTKAQGSGRKWNTSSGQRSFDSLAHKDTGFCRGIRLWISSPLSDTGVFHFDRSPRRGFRKPSVRQDRGKVLKESQTEPHPRLYCCRWSRDFPRECLLGGGGKTQHSRGGGLSRPRMARGDCCSSSGDICHFLQGCKELVGREQGGFQVSCRAQAVANIADAFRSDSSPSTSTASQWGIHSPRTSRHPFDLAVVSSCLLPISTSF